MNVSTSRLKTFYREAGPGEPGGAPSKLRITTSLGVMDISPRKRRNWPRSIALKRWSIGGSR